MKKFLITSSLISILIISSAFLASPQPIQAATPASSAVSCITITHYLIPNSKDSRTQGQVTKLQNFLVAEGYLHASPTGNFGPLTEAALQAFQKAQNIVSSGNYISTGYGATGPKTRTAIKNVSCNGDTVISTLPLGCLPGYKFNTLTGKPCTTLAASGTNSSIPGCTTGALFSTFTGQSCLVSSTTTTQVSGQNNNSTLTTTQGTNGNSNNSGNTNPVQIFPAGAILVPGTGFTGVTAQPATIGSGFASDAKAIAQWDVVQYQTFSGNFNVGVVAFHTNGIDHVSFSVNGGPWTNISQATLNPQTNVTEYWATLRASDFPDGHVEVRAIAYPTVGIPRVLAGTFTPAETDSVYSLNLFANANGTLTNNQVIYVSQSGSNTTGDGSLNKPFGTLLDMALSKVTDGGTIIIKDPGTYYISGETGNENGVGNPSWANLQNKQWVTVKAASGIDKTSILIKANVVSGHPAQLIPHIARLHWYGVGFDIGSGQYTPNPGDLVWFDNNYWTESAGWADAANTPAPPIANWSGSQTPDFSYCTDGYAFNSVYGFACDFVRNITAQQISGSPALAPKLGINVTIKDYNSGWLSLLTNPPSNPYHRDMWHAWWGPQNVIAYGWTCTDACDSTVIRLEGAPPVSTNDVAFENWNIVNIPSVNGNISNWGTSYVAVGTTVNNLLFQNFYTPNNRWAFVDNDPLVAHDFVIKNSGLHWASYNAFILNPQTNPPGLSVLNQGNYQASVEDWAPSNLTATVSGGQVSLSWQPGNGTDPLTVNSGFAVYRSSDNGATWQELTSCPSSSNEGCIAVPSYTDTVSSPGTYQYYVQSVNWGSGGLEYTNVASATVTSTQSQSQAPVISLSANPTSVSSGSSSTLTWSVTNASSCSASNGWSGTKALSGSQSTGALTNSTTYTLSCTGTGGTTNQSTIVTVSSSQNPAPTVTISASPTSISSGSSATLTWSTSNASSCTASGGWSGSKQTSGSQSTGALTTTTTYILSCTGAGGTTQQSTTVTISSQSRPQSTPANGLVGLWTFDAAAVSGSTAYDTSGNNLDATLVNNPAFVVGQIGQSLSLNGVNQYADVPSSSLLNFGTGPYTFAAWINPQSPVSGSDRIMSKRGGPGWFAFDASSGSVPALIYSSSDGNNLYLNTTGADTYGTWQHVVIVRDASGCKSLYVNGSLVRSGECESPIVNVTNSADLLIGAWSSDTFKGSIDDVRIYNRVLSSSEVSQLYAGTLSTTQTPANSSNLANVLTSTLNLLPHALPGTSYYQSLINTLSNTLHALGIK